MASIMSDTPVIHFLASCDTVMNEARRRAAVNELPFFASVLAETQTAGRGRHGHAWASPAGNLYAAIRLPDHPPFSGLTGPMVVSTAVAQVLEHLGLTVKLKWPNDLALLAPQRQWCKCAGILLEKKGDLLIAGIGLNLVSHPDAAQLREKAALPAGDLSQCLTRVPDAPNLWRQIAARLCAVENSSVRTWKSYAERHMLWLGEEVFVSTTDRTISGRFMGLGEAGELRLSTAEGEKFLTEGSLCIR